LRNLSPYRFENYKNLPINKFGNSHIIASCIRNLISINGKDRANFSSLFFILLKH